MSTFENTGFRTIGFDLQKSAIRELRGYWKSYVREAGACPDIFSGRGIVICAGGLRYFTCAWITIRVLRRNGCTLPIELWCVGNEISREIKEELRQFDVVVRDFLEHGPTTLSGCMLKPLAILRSSFREIIFIDADNVCVGDPEELFESGEYMQYGAIFWQDFWQTTPGNPIWAIIDAPYEDVKEQESGQIVVDKVRCWRELNLCLHFNELHTVYHRLLLGDKDTFRFAWIALKTPYFMVGQEPGACGYAGDKPFMGTTIMQYDLRGEFYFLHRNLLKWDVTRNDERVWRSIKRFLPGATEKKYVFGVSENGHYFVDLEGDVETMDLSALFPGLEEICMEYLEGLRASSLYKRFVMHSHFAAHRYTNGTAFTLDHQPSFV